LDEFDHQGNNSNTKYTFFFDTFFKVIRSKDFPQEKLTFLLKDSSLFKNYSGIVVLNIDPVERAGRREAEAKKEKEKEKQEKQGATKVVTKVVVPVKIVFESDFVEKTVILHTFINKKMILVKNSPFEFMIRTNILECASLLGVKLDSETETKEVVREKIENYVNNIEELCMKKIIQNENLDEYTYDISIN